MAKAYPVCNYRDYTPTRNPYGARIAAFVEEGAGTLLADQATEQFRGGWRARFGLPPAARLELELGAYHGETSNHLARTQPQAAHLGVEWKYKQCFMAGKKARDQGLRNVCFLRANNARLAWMLEPGEADRIWVLFPDPWSRLSQGKHRLLQPGFLRMLGCLQRPGQELMIKTDHPEYAAFIAESLAEAACYEPQPERRARESWSLIPPTPFERIFLRQKLPIHSFALLRNEKPVLPPKEVEHKFALS